MRIIGLVIFCFFYAVYIGKALFQRRRGIRTDQMARRKNHDRVYYTELVMKAATYAVAISEVVAILLWGAQTPLPLRIAGIALGVCGDALFLCAVITMRDSWRAGVAEGEDTELVTDGIYRFSRNPAFLAFDLVYAGLLLMFFHPVLLVFTLFAAIMLHLQMVQEERCLIKKFGAPYTAYCQRVRRYLGRRRATFQGLAGGHRGTDGVAEEGRTHG